MPEINWEDVLKKTKEYIAQCKDEQYKLIKTEGNKTTTYENKLKVQLPCMAGLANYIGVTKQTLYNWEKQNAEFAELKDMILQLQEERLVNNGLSGDYNSVIDKVILTKHGYRDVVESHNVLVTEEELKAANNALEDL